MVTKRISLMTDSLHRSRWNALYLSVLLVVPLCGCSQRLPAPAELVYSGHNVPYWLNQAKSKQPKERKHAVDVLGNVGPSHPDAIPALASALKDSEASVRLAAVLGLSKIGGPANAALPALEATLKDADPRIAEAARNAIKHIREEQ